MSTIIKAGVTGKLLSRPTTVDLADHLAEARDVVAQARREAAGIVARAREATRQAGEEGRREGYAAGFEQGEAAGREAGFAAARAAAEARFEQAHADAGANLRRVIETLDASREDLRLAAEVHVADFAIEVARKLTFALGEIHRESAAENLRRALEVVVSRSDVTVRMHPEDMATLESFAGEVLARWKASAAVRLVADESIVAGGCVVETDATRVDATLPAQLDELVEQLAGRSRAS